MNAKFTPFIALFLLLIATVSAASFDVSDVRVSVTYPEPYDRFSDRIDGDDGLVDGDAIVADIFPGSLVEFIFTVENILDDDDDGDINNIVGTITVEDLDDGDDVEVETDDVDLDAGNDAKLRATVKIPERVEAQEYEVEIVVEGDTNSSTETITINLILDVTKESSDLKVTEYRVSPSTIGCERNIRLYAVMTNLGKDTERNAAFEARSDALGISIKRTDIELTDDPFDEESEYILNEPFTVPKDVAAGKYAIDYNAWFQNEIIMDKRSVELTVTSCATDADDPIDGPGENGNGQNGSQTGSQTGSQPNQPTLPTTQGSSETIATGNQNGEDMGSEPIVTSSVERPFTSSPLFIAGMVLLNILVISVIIIAVAKAITLQKKKEVHPDQGKKSKNSRSEDE